MITHEPKDYAFLPADMRTFIAKTEAAYPPDAVTFSNANFMTNCAPRSILRTPTVCAPKTSPAPVYPAAAIRPPRHAPV